MMLLLSSEVSGAELLLSVPDDVFAIISRSLSPRDICNLSMCCRRVFDLAGSDKIWLTQCEMLKVVSSQDLMEWRNGVMSYKALCRFLFSVRPLIGIWVHQNPELGNVVYVMPGFVSVVGCRIIPQELGPLGIEDGPILWAPVFEIVGDCNGLAVFLLHGRDKEEDFLYPGSVKSIEKNCNVLLLEVEPCKDKSCSRLIHSKSFVHHSAPLQKISYSDQGLSKSQRVVIPNAPVVPPVVPFSRLAFGDRRKLLELITSRVAKKVPNLAKSPLFLCSRNDEESFKQDLAVLFERRLLLLKIYNLGTGHADWKSGSMQLELSEIRKNIDRASGFRSSLNGDDVRAQISKRKSLGGLFRKSIKQILGKSSAFSVSQSGEQNGYIGNENKHAKLNEFLRSGDTVGLTIHASTMKLTSYRAWPNMHDSQFALYKIPMQAPTIGREYAGLWGGTFGWPPGKPTEDKPGKALFFLLLSYEESEGQLLLIATKILEGTNYVLHPNGSAMFTVNVNESSTDTFPWTSDADSLPINVEHAFTGEGIANGYGFRYPGSKPGSLFVVQDGLLVFIWKDSRTILTLQRLNLEDLLRKGERVPALPPIANFSYLTKSYSNVFAGFGNTTNCLSSPSN